MSGTFGSRIGSNAYLSNPLHILLEIISHKNNLALATSRKPFKCLGVLLLSMRLGFSVEKIHLVPG